MSQIPPVNTYAQSYLSRFQTYQDELLQRLETLVNIDSGTRQAQGINRIMAYLQEWLTELGFTVTLHPSEPFGNNLVARRKGKGKARIMLVGHVDTVYEAGSVEKRPFCIRDGIAYGPGVIDMKSGDLMGIYALRALAEAGFEQYDELCVVFNNDEEVGSAGSAPLLKAIAKEFSVGLVLEPASTLEQIINSRKGTNKYIMQVAGIASHSGSSPTKGRSAVLELAHKIIAIHNLHSLFHNVTFNVTDIRSNEQLNIIPDKASCQISVRGYTNQSLDKAAEALEQIAAGSSVPDTRTTLIRTRGRPPYTSTPALKRLEEMVVAEGQALGLKLVLEPRGGVSDANLLMGAGVPTLDSLGPVGGNLHNLQKEYLQIDTLPIRGSMLAGLLQHICLSNLTGA
ncbi:M20 family peptidase [Ktedonosporobacter rubrisoli]|uniref:M20 family peptidase n=1 Tax=Ktedonosporobacter rubrisoli TaxID=2509675 RepID=A0A4P6JZI3_KTERU|nr:M20 family metallopeptidase [Ktedonosporobacter rubrisoli]QBD80902.1 M20 family peptidase [Ktedonosporobacter rubrisoli]